MEHAGDSPPLQSCCDDTGTRIWEAVTIRSENRSQVLEVGAGSWKVRSVDLQCSIGLLFTLHVLRLAEVEPQTVLAELVLPQLDLRIEFFSVGGSHADIHVICIQQRPRVRGLDAPCHRVNAKDEEKR